MSSEDKQTVLDHLSELRKSLLISVAAIFIAAMGCFFFNEFFLKVVTYPVRAIGQTLIATGVTEAFFVKLQLSFLAGFILAFPIVSWAVWRFIKPALYPNERRLIYILFPATLVLFVGGVTFAYFVVLPLVLNFMVYIAGENLETMFKVDQYVSFVMAFIIPFGLTFELPIVTYFLTKLGVLKPEKLSQNRKYALLIIVILGGVLSPGPDPISQIMMAGPVYLLYEVSILVAKHTKPRGQDEEEPEENAADPS
ncbi:MAG: twin-arginine translocase subunit TatC [Syntrophomonadaceae bacterium]|nr:twin-arginine translocase subunit TatC [Syntrophomonadaceae bacterium]